MSTIQLRRDTTANWLSVNPVLAQGELGIAYNGDVVATIRIGNGAATWTQLPDFGGNGDLTQAAADLLYATLAQGSLADTAVQPGDLPTFGDVVTHNASEFATAAQGTDARTPTAHAASHATAGSDPLTVAQSQVTNLGTDLAAKVPTSRTIAGLGLDADRSSDDLKTALTLVKGDVGLGSVDNTADADKPVSTLQAAADSAAVATAIQRSNHTGTQLLSTISDAGTAAGAALDTDTTAAADSDIRVMSQKAVRAYVAAATASSGGKTYASRIFARSNFR